MTATLPQYAAIERDYAYGVSDAAVQALYGNNKYTTTSGSSAALLQVLQRVWPGSGASAKLSGATFGVAVSAAGGCDAIWLSIIRTPAGVNPNGVNEELVVKTPNELEEPLSADCLHLQVNDLEWLPSTLYDYYLRISVRRTEGVTGTVGLYMLPAVTGMADTTRVYRGDGEEPVEPMGGMWTAAWPVLGRWTITTAACVTRVIPASTVGANGKVYLFPRCTTHLQHVHMANITPGGAANLIRVDLKSMGAAGAMSDPLASFMLDFTTGKQAGAWVIDGEIIPYDLAATELGTDLFRGHMVINPLTGVDTYDAWLTNLSHKGRGGESDNDVSTYSMCKETGTNVMGSALGDHALHDFIAVSGSSAASHGTITVCCEPVVVVGDSNGGRLVTGDGGVGLGSRFTLPRLVHSLCVGGNCLTLDGPGLHVSGAHRFRDPTDTQARVGYIPGALFVIAFCVNDWTQIVGVGDSEKYSADDRVSQFVARVADMLALLASLCNDVLGNGYSFDGRAVVVGPFKRATYSAEESDAVSRADSALSAMCRAARVAYVSASHVVAGDDPHLTAAQAATIDDLIAAAYESGQAPRDQGDDSGDEECVDMTDLVPLPVVEGDGAEHEIALEAGQTLLIHPVGGQCEVRTEEAADEYVSVDNLKYVKLTTTSAASYYVKAPSGVVVQCALVS